MQHETSDTIQNLYAPEASEKDPQLPAIYKKRFESKQPAYNLGRFEYSELNNPTVFTLSTGEKLTVSSEINDISNEFFNGNSEKDYSQKSFWNILKRILTEQQIQGVHSSTKIELELAGFHPDIEVSEDDPTIKDSIGDTHDAQFEMNHMVVNELLKWFDNLATENKKVSQKKISIPSLDVTFQTIVIGNVEQSTSFWSVDEQIVNMLYFIKNTLHLNLPREFRIFVVATLDVEDLNNQQHSSDLINMIDILGVSNQNNAIILEQAVFSMDSDSGKMMKTIDTLTSQALTTHEIAHICDTNGFQSTEVQKEAFAVALHSGMNFQKTISIVVKNQPQKNALISKDFEELFSVNPPDHLKAWQVYGLSAALYCYIYEQFGPQKFIQFYQEITNNKENSNLTSALQSIEAMDQYQIFIDIINEAIAKKH